MALLSGLWRRLGPHLVERRLAPALPVLFLAMSVWVLSTPYDPGTDLADATTNDIWSGLIREGRHAIPLSEWKERGYPPTQSSVVSLDGEYQVVNEKGPAHALLVAALDSFGAGTLTGTLCAALALALVPFMVGLLVVLAPPMQYNATYFGGPLRSGYDATSLLDFSRTGELTERNQSVQWSADWSEGAGNVWSNSFVLAPIIFLRMPLRILVPAANYLKEAADGRLLTPGGPRGPPGQPDGQPPGTGPPGSTGPPGPEFRTVALAELLGSPEAYAGQFVRVENLTVSEVAWPLVNLSGPGGFITARLDNFTSPPAAARPGALVDAQGPWNGRDRNGNGRADPGEFVFNVKNGTTDRLEEAG